MKASLKNYRQAPRKVRLVIDVVRGKTVDEALTLLTHMPQKAALPIKKLIASAAANARQKDTSRTDESLVVSTITADKGLTFTRYMPRAFGRAAPINRESSHVKVELRDREPVNR